MDCPHCKQPLILAKPKSLTQSLTGPPISPAPGRWTRQNNRQFNNSAPTPWQSNAAAAIPDYASYERRAPAREPTLQADVLVPAAQAFLTGLVIAIPSAALAGLLEYDFKSSLAIGAGVGLTAITVTWLIKMGTHSQLLWLIESVTGRDIDGDGEAGRPEPETPPPAPAVKLEVSHTQNGNIQSMKMFDLPDGVTMEMLKGWANQVTNGIKTPARSNWVGRGKPFSRGQYDQFLNSLEKAGLVRNVGDGKGRQLTNGGKRALKRLL